MQQLKAPLLYDRSVEHHEPDEEDTGAELNETFRQILETTAQDEGRAVRAVHAKSHGLLKGVLTVLDGLPAEYAQGLFAHPGDHPVLLRFSAIPGDILPDEIALPKGLSVKVLDVQGERLPSSAPGAEDARTQDFVLVNSPSFSASSAKQFLGSLKLLAKTTDRMEWAKKLLSKVLQPVEAGLEALGTESAMVKQLGGAPNTHPFGELYFSQTAFRFGNYIAKFQVAPVSQHLLELTGTPIDASDDPDAMRHAIEETIAEAPGLWELRVQLCRDLNSMPVEDPTVEWPQNESPFVAVARIHVPIQPGWSAAREHAIDDGMKFSVWNGLAAHQPLGAINRVRRGSYEMSARFRGQVNGCPMHEPASLANVPDR